MLRSEPQKKGDFFVGWVVHPAAGDVDDTRLQMKDGNIWHFDGCSAANVCAHREFRARRS
jgi:hypothetical protein